MIDVHVTPDEFNQLRDAIDQATRTAVFIDDPAVDVYPIVSLVLGDDVARSVRGECARLVVHFDSVIPQRLTEPTP